MKKLLILAVLFANIYAKEIAFLGFVDSEWKIFAIKDNKLKTIKSKYEPRSFDYDFIDKKVIYVGADENIRLIKNSRDTILKKRDKSSYIQPKFDKNGKNIYFVKLIDGNSKKSDIYSLNLASKKMKKIVYQVGTQLEPYIQDIKNLYYTNVACTIGCREIISEIWHKNVVSTRAMQLTLTNYTTQQPTVDKRGEYLYFSSNKRGNFHIWRLSLEKSRYKQLTKGDVTDSFSAVSSDGDIYFVRQIDNDYSVMKIDKNGKLSNINLPKKIEKIRYLRVK